MNYPKLIKQDERSSTLFKLSDERDAIVNRVIERVTRKCVQDAWDDPTQSLDRWLNEAAFVELERYASDPTQLSPEQLNFWRGVVRAILHTSAEENEELLRRAVTDCVHDIAGDFRPALQTIALKAVPKTLSLLLGSGFSGRNLEDAVSVQGDIAHIRALAEIGTLVFVSTHVSRIDAAMIGLAMNIAGLPSLVHGADRVLFENKMTAPFMSKLGAYKVDRKRSHTIYKRVLKAYSQIMLERGYHSFFFPTGGRSRSNTVNSRLKLGLMGTALDAWTQSVLEGQDRPVFIVPITLNYDLVLEASTLVSEYITVPDARDYRIIEQDEFASARRVASYLKASMDNSPFLTVHYGTPMDPFGNEVSVTGASVDQQGRRLDAQRYLWKNGVPAYDAARARAYTRGLGRRILASWKQNNTISPLHIVSFALFEYMRRQHPGWSVERLLWFARGDAIAATIAEGETERMIRILRRDAADGKLRLTQAAQEDSSQEMVRKALKIYHLYHRTPVAEKLDHTIRLQDMRLLYFYSNRLRGYDIERRLDHTPGGY